MANISVVPNYLFVFPFESSFDQNKTIMWMAENWTLSFYWVATYLLVIFTGQCLLRNRKSYQLRGCLTTWNTVLAIFSFVGACRTAPELFHVLRYHGFVHSVCVASSVLTDKVSAFWTWMFVISKVPELGDTLFVVLRKQPLHFLHYYHHSTVLIYAWFSHGQAFPTGRWFAVMNYSVHSIMYSYYALRAARIKVPRFCAMIVTLLQLLQMVVGCFLNIYMFNYREQLGPAACRASAALVNAALAMYISYFLLFARLFYKSYVFSDSSKSGKARSKALANQLDPAKSKIH